MSIQPTEAPPAAAAPPSPIRVALLCDYREEGWASMDLFGEMIERHLREWHAGAVEPTAFRPPYRRPFGRLPAPAKVTRNADRLWNRFVTYPRAVRGLARSGRFDLFHLMDHSYGQMAHELPADRTIITCHDLDTFRCVLEPTADPRPAWFRAMAGRILAGLRRAAAVACVSEATREELLAHGLVPPERVRVIPTAVPPEFRPEPDPEADARAGAMLGPRRDDPAAPDLLHVGTTIPRKRIDVLLRAFAGIREALPGARLLRAGGPLTAAQAALAAELGVADAVLSLPFLDRPTLAAVYRRADLVLQPSDAEGFGLPLAEALACGAPALASDIPALREVGGGAASYAPAGDPATWARSALALLADLRRDRSARVAAGLERAGRYRWSAHADDLMTLYREVLDRSANGPISS